MPIKNVTFLGQALQALIEFHRNDSEAGMSHDCDRCPRQIWRAERFSLRFTSCPFAPPYTAYCFALYLNLRAFKTVSPYESGALRYIFNSI